MIYKRLSIFHKTFLLVLLSTQLIDAQIFTYTAEDGLPSRNVTNTLEDHEGFLWVATNNGLVRFDGNEFIVLKNIGKDSANLRNADITTLAITPGGQLCIGTSKGLALLSADRSELWYPIPDTNPASIERVVSVAAFDDQHIAFTNFEGMYILSKGKIQKVMTFPKRMDGLTWAGLRTIDSNRMMVIYVKPTHKGREFLIVNRSGDTLHKNTVNHPYLSGTIGPDNRVYFASISSDPGETNKICVESYSIQGEAIGKWQMEPPVPVSGSGDHFQIFSASGHLWISEGTMPLIHFDHEKGDFSLSVGEEIARKKTPIASNFSNIYGDAHENLWLSTNGGLLGLSLKQDGFQVLKPEHLPKDEIYSTRLIRPLDKKHLFLSKSGDSYLINREDQEFTSYNPLKPNGASPNIRCMLPFGKDSLLIGTEWSGLFWLERGSNTMELALKDTASFGRSVMSMVLAKDGKVWGGGIGGLFWFDPRKGILHEMKDFGFQEIETVYELSYNPETDLIWAASDKGLLKFEIETGKFKIYDLRQRSGARGSSKSICLIRKKNLLWVGTWGNGLVRFDIAKEEITHFTTQNGLCNSLVYSMLEDDSGRIWLGTANGLSAFDPSTEGFVSYFKEDGIAHNEFNTGSVYKDPEGFLYMGGLNGVTRFKPDQILGERESPELRLTKIVKHDGETNEEHKTTLSIQQVTALTINPHDRYFTVFFSHKDLLHPSKTFEYQLKGLADNWSFLGSSKEIRFAGLSPGKYTLSIRTTDDTENANILSLPIRILAPWYKSWWAMTTFFTVGLGLIVLFFMLRIQRLQADVRLKLEQEKVKRKEELDHIKSDFFADISHEFRTPITLILGPLEKRLKRKHSVEAGKDFGIMKRNALRLLVLVNELLDLSKLDDGKMKLRLSQKDMVPHLRMIVGGFESMAQPKNIRLKLICDENSLSCHYDPNKLEKIFYNLISNAIKFGEQNSVVEISCTLNDNRDKLLLNVSNSGNEIPPSQLQKVFDRFHRVKEHSNMGTGLGLALTKQLVELHGGRIWVESAKQLTTFTVELPFHQTGLLNQQDDESESDDAAIEINDPNDVSTGEDSSPKQIATAEAIHNKEPELPLVQIVDDNPDIRTFVADCLKNKYQVIEAINGAEGVELARQQIPDLVISDLMMPQMDGHELCHHLKTDELTSHIPIILLTAKANRDSKLQGLRMGADDYMLKPFDSEELALRIHNLIRLRQKLKEKYGGSKLPETAKKPALDLEDEFLQKVIALMDEHLHEEDFAANILYQKLFLSPRQIQRKLKALSGMTPTNFIRQYRLQIAYEKIQKREGTISEIAVSVGIPNLAYFSRAFKKEFGVPPSEL